jgi:hypothetical protein
MKRMGVGERGGGIEMCIHVQAYVTCVFVNYVCVCALYTVRSDLSMYVLVTCGPEPNSVYLSVAGAGN